MHPVDEFLALRADIRRLEARAAELRAAFLAGEVPLRSSGAEVVVARHSRRVLLQDRLPGWVQSDPRLWQTRHLRIVKAHSLGTDTGPDGAGADDPLATRRQRLAGNATRQDGMPIRPALSPSAAPPHPRLHQATPDQPLPRLCVPIQPPGEDIILFD